MSFASKNMGKVAWLDRKFLPNRVNEAIGISLKDRFRTESLMIGVSPDREVKTIKSSGDMDLIDKAPEEK